MYLVRLWRENEVQRSVLGQTAVLILDTSLRYFLLDGQSKRFEVRHLYSNCTFTFYIPDIGLLFLIIDAVPVASLDVSFFMSESTVPVEADAGRKEERKEGGKEGISKRFEFNLFRRKLDAKKSTCISRA